MYNGTQSVVDSALVMAKPTGSIFSPLAKKQGTNSGNLTLYVADILVHDSDSKWVLGVAFLTFAW